VTGGKRISRRLFQLGWGSLFLPKCFSQAPDQPDVRISPGAGSERRLALVMGNDAYLNFPALRNSVNDAGDLGDQLTKLGFTVSRSHDAEADAARRAVSQFTSRLRPGDCALFFYAGHGIQARGENYIVPVDFDKSIGEAKLSTACVSASAVRDSMERSGSRLNIVILDACRDNLFRPGEPVKGMAVMEAGPGTCVVLSTGPGQTASDGPARNGLFSKCLIEGLRSPGKSLDALLKDVKEQVYRESGQKQRPWIFYDMIGDFYFAAAAGGGIAPGQAGDLIEAGRKQLQQRQFQEAANNFDRALRIDPENPFTYNALGSAHARLKEWSEAVGFYAKAIQLRPDFAAAYYNRGLAYFNAARYDLAVQDFSWALDNQGTDPLVFERRGEAYLSMRDRENALADFNSALDLNPASAPALAGRGKVFFRQGEYAQAIRDLSASIDLQPAASAYEARADVYRAQHKGAEADADMRRAEQMRQR
jgi:tetratricopeptide (TPR) repeat protein